MLAVSKTQPASRIAEARAAGQHAFGENYVQEALEKVKIADMVVSEDASSEGPATLVAELVRLT